MTTSDEAPQLTSVWARFMGVIVSPTAVFKEVVVSPRPVGILALVCLVLGLGTGAPQFTERGQRAAVDQQVRQSEALLGSELPADARAAMERRAPYGPYLAMAGMFVAMPIFSVIFTGLYWFFFNVVLGGTATFKQALGVVTHSNVIAALGALAAAPVLMMQDIWLSNAGPYNFAALVPMVDSGSWLASFLGLLTPFTIWQSIVTGIGYATLYRRRTGNVVVGMLIFSLLLSAAFASLPFLFRRG